MTAGRGSGLSSPFDDMLEQTRKQFDELSGGLAPVAAPGTERRRPTPAAHRGTDPVRFLDDRYGDGWRYQVTERRQDGGEAVVHCKLVIADRDITRTGIGRARIERTGPAVEISGRADGVAFTARAEAAAPEISLQAAFDTALTEALSKCAELL
jgi:hypothetical protein